MFFLFIRISVVTLLVTACVMTGIGWKTYSDTMQIRTHCETSTPDLFVQSRSDAVSIAARYTEKGPAAKVVLLVHSLDECMDDPRLVATTRAYQDMGYTTLAIDMRSHGASGNGGNVHGFGSLRAYDVLGAFDWLTAQGVPAGDIILHGQSLGGSAVLLAAQHDPRITRVIAESPILNFDRIVRDGGSPGWFLPVFKAVGRLRGFDLSHQPVQVCDALAGQAVLITHATGDPVTPVSQLDFVPPDQTTCTPYRIDGDWHVGWAQQRPADFKRVITDWLAQHPG